MLVQRTEVRGVPAPVTTGLVERVEATVVVVEGGRVVAVGCAVVTGTVVVTGSVVESTAVVAGGGTTTC
jgi:hypothetical protein